LQLYRHYQVSRALASAAHNCSAVLNKGGGHLFQGAFSAILVEEGALGGVVPLRGAESGTVDMRSPSAGMAVEQLPNGRLGEEPDVLATG
jgi:hypothetical protein